MRNYTKNLPQFWKFVKDDVTNKIEKLANFESRFDFDLRFFLKVIFLEGVSLNNVKFHKIRCLSWGAVML